MALSKLGDLITLISEKCNINNLTVTDVSGINKEKEFFSPTVQVGADTSNYKIVPPNHFACNLMHVGRDYAIPIAINKTNKNIIVSPAYSVFYVAKKDIILDEYMYMIFKKIDFDRYAAFCTDSSIRDGLELNRFLEIEFELPSLEIQQKTVDLYLAMVANQKTYQKGLDDMKKTCDLYIENLRQQKMEIIGDNIYEVVEKNTEGIKEESGVSVKKEFIKTKSSASDISNQKIVRVGSFAFNSNTSRNGNVISIALNKDIDRVVSNTYVCFKTKEKFLSSKYLFLWFKRKEFDRYARFKSWGSARETISLKDISEYQISLPSIKIQNSISEIFEVYEKRREINEKLKQLINQVCPILIKKSID
jgi:type I restriction enzyme S subunit